MPIPGSLEAIAQLSKAGFGVAVATNQSAIGRRYFGLDTLHRIHQKLRDLLVPHGGHLEPIVYCPHRPDEGCGCRKPAPGMLLEIAECFGRPPEELWFVGDSATDIEAARRAGARGVLVRTGNGTRHLAEGRIPEDTAIFDDLAAVALALIAKADAERELSGTT